MRLGPWATDSAETANEASRERRNAMLWIGVMSLLGRTQTDFAESPHTPPRRHGPGLAPILGFSPPAMANSACMGPSVFDDQTRAAASQAAESRSEALGDILERHYESLLGIAAAIFKRESPGNSLSPTALVHEAYLALLHQPSVSEGGTLFFRACFARQCRRVLVEHARRREALRRGGSKRHETLSTQVELGLPGATGLLEINDAMEHLAELDPRMAQIADMRLFAGMTIEQCAEALDVSPRTISKQWAFAQSYLQRELR